MAMGLLLGGTVLGLSLLSTSAMVMFLDSVLSNRLLWLMRIEYCRTNYNFSRVNWMAFRAANLLGDKGNEIAVACRFTKIRWRFTKSWNRGRWITNRFTSSISVNSLLNNLRSTAEQAEHELRLQASSYEKLEMLTKRIKCASLIFRRSNRWMDFTIRMDLECVFHPIYISFVRMKE